MAINNSSSRDETKYFPLYDAVCTKEMILRAKPTSNSDKKGTLSKGTIIFIDTKYTQVKNVHGNIWIKNFYKIDKDHPCDIKYMVKNWMCISNSNMKVPTHSTIQGKTVKIYSKPSTKSDVVFELNNYVTPLYVNTSRINNDSWGLVSYYDLNKKKTYTGYIFQPECNLYKMNYNLKKYDKLWMNWYETMGGLVVY